TPKLVQPVAPTTPISEVQPTSDNSSEVTVQPRTVETTVKDPSSTAEETPVLEKNNVTLTGGGENVTKELKDKFTSGDFTV
ncbi:sialidase, partial [Streptococcus pneumoniae]|nr:sialidase [Streptococcus pneumoniae]